MPGAVRWDVRTPRPELADRLARALNIDPIVAHILATHGYDTPEEAQRFLDAPLDALSDADLIVDVPAAAEEMTRALAAGDPITIYGDYDADGVTATSILLRGLGALGGRVTSYIPSRFSEGYGLNDAALRRIAAGGGNFVVAVDCGVTAVEEVQRAAERSQRIIIVDHHEPAAALPPALAVIDPKRRDATAPFREYSAAGLAFQLLRAVRRRLGKEDIPADLLDLAALGTIADVVPLVEENRILARWGLARMGTTVGVAALIRAAGLTGEITARRVGFSLAPRINAAGRLGDASVAVRLLTTDDPAEADAIASTLEEENRQRRELCDQILAQAVDRVEREKLHEGPAIVLAGDGWHAGVIGIVASRLVERYYRPVVLMAVDQGIGKGSARSIEPLHMVEALQGCSDLLTRFGGHAMAAGLTIPAEHIADFSHRFIDVAAARLHPDDLVPSMTIEAEVPLAAITEALARQMQRLAPFGAGNPEPVLAVRGLRAVTTRVMGDGLHLRLGVTDGHAYAEAVGFRLGDASELLAFTRAQVDLAFSVGLDRWEDRERVQLVLRDLQTPGIELDEVLTDSRLLVERLFARAADYLGNGALGLEEAGAFNTKVAGVTFEGRQDIVRSLSAGDLLVLRREPENPHDPHAITVSTATGEQIGYLSARVAARLAPSMDSGARYAATVSQITGGGDRHYGVNIYLQRQDAPADEADPTQQLRAVWRDLPVDDLIDRLRVHLRRGRPLRAMQQEAVGAVAAGRGVLGVFGPGRGRQSVIEVIAAAEVVAGRGPVVIAVPFLSQVERWYDRLAPRLRQIGVTSAQAHGAMLFRQRQRLAEAVREGRADVIIASLAYLRQARLGMRPALLLLECEPAIDPLALDEILRALGGPRWCAFSASQEGAEIAALAERGRLEPVVDVFQRTNLRLVDRRNPRDRLEAILGILERREKTLIHVSTRAEAVDLGAQLRERRGGEVAYYHGGLPLRVREVLEQMYTDGKIRTLVASDGFREEGAPADLRQVVIAGLPRDRAELLEWIGVAGLDGRQAGVTLLHRRDDLVTAEAEFRERHPTREMLMAIYRAVRDEATRAGAAVWPEERLAAALDGAVPSRRTVGIGLDVLAEAGVIQREFDGERWHITLPEEAGRRDLSTSLRYTEGQRQAEGLADLARWAFGPLAGLLRAAAGPSTGTRP